MRKLLTFLTVALAAAFIAATPAQSQVLQITATVAGTATNIPSGGSASITAPATGQAVFAVVSVQYTGIASATINSLTLTGTTEMAVVQTTPALPSTLNPGQNLSFTVQYVSTTGLATAGQAIIGYSENSVAATFPFTLNGTAGRLTYSYAIQPSGAATAVTPGGSIAFPSTNLNSSTTAVVTIFNAGSAASSLQSAGVSGTAFQVSGSATPLQLAPGQQTTFTVTFAPQTAGTAQATLTLGLTVGSATFTLTGTGTTANFSVTYTLADGNTHNLANGSAIAFPAVDVNGSTTATISILNQGTGSGAVTAVSVTGAGFQVRSLAALPATVNPSQSLTFQIVFTAAQAGSASGSFSFTVGGVTIAGTLAGSTLSPAFSVVYTDPNTNNVIALQDGSTLPFPSTLVSSSASISMAVINSGSGTGVLNSIALGGGSASTFQILNQPALPASIPASQRTTFSIRFSPLQQQTFAATLVLNLNGQAFTVTLTGQGTVKGQTLQVSVSANGINTGVSAGGSVSITSPGTGQAVLASVSAQYTGTASITVNSLSLTGTSEMTLLQPPAFPLTLNPGGTLTFTVQYTSAAGAAATGQVSIAYTESGQSSSFAFTLNGTAARFTYSYAVQPSGAATSVNPGDSITFPSTNVGANTTVSVTVLNSGSTASSLLSISSSNSFFQISGSPAPMLLNPGQRATFSIVFTPQVSGTALASMTIGLSGASATFSLTGTGSSPNFSAAYTLADGNVHTLSSGSTITFPSVDINGTATATISIANQGTGSGSVTAVSVSGAGFQTKSLAALPATVAANQTFSFQITFTPTQAGSFNGSFSLAMSGTTITGSLAGATSSPTFSVAYTDPGTNNTITLSNGSTLSFPNTQVNASSSISLVVTNNGAGTGLLNSITLGGSSASVFQVLNQPSLPASVGPSQRAGFSIRFSPLQQQTFSATLTLNLNGQTVTVTLSGQGTGPQYTYTWASATASNAVTPGGTVAMGDTAVGQTTTVTISVTNAGSGDGQIPAISVTGTGFTFTSLPNVPLTLHAGGSQTFKLNFAPTQPGVISGTMTIGTDTFTVTATGIGSLLTYSYTNSASTVPVTAAGMVIFPPTAVESTASLTFTIQNTGTSSATISSINLGAASTIFSLQQMPALPTNLNAGGSLTFSVSFVPNTTGNLTATLLVNSIGFTLSGTGTQPAALPAYQFQGPSGTQPAAQQPSIGLTLSTGYPLALQGALTLTFTSAVFTDDPAIQFAAGGRTVKFSIPANSTQAVFTGGSTTMPIQTGTTAGTIVITPSFATQSGFALTPDSPPALTLNIARSIAQLTNQSVTAETTTSFTVLLSGYSTTRALTQLTVQINPKAGATFSTTSLTINVASTASSWFQSLTSQAYGGGFSVAIPFTLSNGATTSDLVHQLQSLTITATNDVGTSSAITVPIP